MIYKEISYQLFLYQNISSDFKILSITSEVIPDLECTETLLAGINPRRYSYIWHKYYGNTAVKSTYANLKAELLQSDKNQVALPYETAIVNVVTSSSVPDPTLPVSLATTSSMDPLNPQLNPPTSSMLDVWTNEGYSSCWMSQLWRSLLCLWSCWA